MILQYWVILMPCDHEGNCLLVNLHIRNPRFSVFHPVCAVIHGEQNQPKQSLKTLDTFYHGFVERKPVNLDNIIYNESRYTQFKYSPKECLIHVIDGFVT
jgi:hypothetical protein